MHWDIIERINALRILETDKWHVEIKVLTADIVILKRDYITLKTAKKASDAAQQSVILDAKGKPRSNARVIEKHICNIVECHVSNHG